MRQLLQRVKEDAMEWFRTADVGLLLLCLWNFVAIAFLPRFMKHRAALGMVVLLVGAAIFWGFQLLEPRSPLMIMVLNIAIIAAALLALLHREIIVRRETGRWALLDTETR
jgi:predicted membrane protein